MIYMEQPNPQVVIAYLKARGWSIKGSTSQHTLMGPPKDLQFGDPSFQYKIPLNQMASDYQEYATRIVFSIADLYRLDRWKLLNLVSQSIDQIKQDIELKKALLAHAS